MPFDVKAGIRAMFDSEEDTGPKENVKKKRKDSRQSRLSALKDAFTPATTEEWNESFNPGRD